MRYRPRRLSLSQRARASRRPIQIKARPKRRRGLLDLRGALIPSDADFAVTADHVIEEAREPSISPTGLLDARGAMLCRVTLPIKRRMGFHTPGREQGVEDTVSTLVPEDMLGVTDVPGTGLAYVDIDDLEAGAILEDVIGYGSAEDDDDDDDGPGGVEISPEAAKALQEAWVVCREKTRQSLVTLADPRSDLQASVQAAIDAFNEEGETAIHLVLVRRGLAETAS